MEIQPARVLGGGRVVSVIRGDSQLTPRGGTRHNEGDILVVSGESVDGQRWGSVNELSVHDTHPWVNKKVSELPLQEGCTLVAIRREGTLLIPDGSTVICAGDLVMLNDGTASAS